MFKVGNEINSLTHFVPVFPFINDDDGDDDDDDDDSEDDEWFLWYGWPAKGV